MSQPIATRIEEHRYTDSATAASALAVMVADRLREGIAARGVASLVVSGGKSPVPFFQALRVQPLDWSKVFVTLADERWVAPDSPDSNERLLREHLLREAAGAAQFLPLKTTAITAAEALAERGAALAALPRPFDAVVLGMGEDGHTASLFPGMPGLAAALEPSGSTPLIAGVAPVAPHERISLTLSALLDSRAIFLPLQGATKLAVYAAARADGSGTRYPIGAALAQGRTPVSVLLALQPH